MTFRDKSGRVKNGPDKSRRSGMVLLVVVIIVALLSLAGFAFVALMSSELDTTRQRSREIQIQFIAQSGASLIESVATQSDFNRKQVGGTYDNPSMFCAVPVARDMFDAHPSARLTIVSPKLDNGRMVGIRYGLVNESAKLHLAKVLEWETAKPGDGVTALRQLPGMTARTAEAILDWIDPDDNPRINGAEAASYAQMRLPYKPRNAVPVTLEEFLLVQGVTRQLMFGDDENFNFVPDSQEQQPGGTSVSMSGALPSGDAEPLIPWVHLLTVTSAERDANLRGAARIDLNDANLEFLHTQLRQRVNDETADFVILYRQYGPAPIADTTSTDTTPSETTMADTLSTTTTRATTTGTSSRRNYQTQFSDYVHLQTPAKFRFETPLDIVEATVAVPLQNGLPPQGTTAPQPAATETSTTQASMSSASTPSAPTVKLKSPLTTDSSSLNSTLVLYLDETSTFPNTTVIGRVNINEAPYEVLAAIPNLSQNAAQQIVNRREQQANGMRDMYRHPTWLLAFDVVDLETLKTLWPDITCGGDVFRGQVIGFYEDIGTFSRIETTVDATVFPPRRIEEKDLTSYGIGFHDRVLFGSIPQQGNAGNVGQQTTPTLADRVGDGTSFADWDSDSYIGTGGDFNPHFAPGMMGMTPNQQTPGMQPFYSDIAPLDVPMD